MKGIIVYLNKFESQQILTKGKRIILALISRYYSSSVQGINSSGTGNDLSHCGKKKEYMLLNWLLLFIYTSIPGHARLPFTISIGIFTSFNPLYKLSPRLFERSVSLVILVPNKLIINISYQIYWNI